MDNVTTVDFKNKVVVSKLNDKVLDQNDSVSFEEGIDGSLQNTFDLFMPLRHHVSYMAISYLITNIINDILNDNEQEEDLLDVYERAKYLTCSVSSAVSPEQILPASFDVTVKFKQNIDILRGKTKAPIPDEEDVFTNYTDLFEKYVSDDVMGLIAQRYMFSISYQVEDVLDPAIVEQSGSFNLVPFDGEEKDYSVLFDESTETIISSDNNFIISDSPTYTLISWVVEYIYAMGFKLNSTHKADYGNVFYHVFKNGTEVIKLNIDYDLIEQTEVLYCN